MKQDDKEYLAAIGTIILMAVISIILVINLILIYNI